MLERRPRGVSWAVHSWVGGSAATSGVQPHGDDRPVSESDWKIFQLSDLLERQDDVGSIYMEFLRVPALSCGLYALKAGSTDLQTPHDEDEVYVVLSGKARVRVSGKEETVSPGSVLYVRATAEHSFFEIEEDIKLMVFFGSGGPAETASE